MDNTTYKIDFILKYCFPGCSDGKESACNARDAGMIPGSGRSSGEGNGYLFQYSCLENSMDSLFSSTLHLYKVMSTHFTSCSRNQAADYHLVLFSVATQRNYSSHLVYLEHAFMESALHSPCSILSNQQVPQTNSCSLLLTLHLAAFSSLCCAVLSRSVMSSSL